MASVKNTTKERKLLRALLKNKKLNFNAGGQKESDILDFFRRTL